MRIYNVKTFVIVFAQSLPFTLNIASMYLVASVRSGGYQCKIHNFVDSRKIIDVDASVHQVVVVLSGVEDCLGGTSSSSSTERDCTFTASTCTRTGVVSL